MKRFLTLVALSLIFGAATAQTTFSSTLAAKPKKGATIYGTVECDGKPLEGYKWPRPFFGQITSLYIGKKLAAEGFDRKKLVAELNLELSKIGSQKTGMTSGKSRIEVGNKVFESFMEFEETCSNYGSINKYERTNEYFIIEQVKQQFIKKFVIRN